MGQRIIIVGGVAGGATAAARIRRLDESAEIVIFERSGFVSYANCGLPYYVGGTIAEQKKLTLRTPGGFWERFRVEVRVRTEVLSIDRRAKTVRVRNLVTGETCDERYDRLVLAPGARPVRPDVPGIGSPRIHQLRTVEDTLRLRAAVTQDRPATALIVGGGFIGLEAAENLAGLGIKVTIADRGSQLLRFLDEDMARIVHAECRARGVELRFGMKPAAFEEVEGGVAAVFEGGERIEAGLVVLAVGVKPDAGLAAGAGLAIGETGGIAVNSRMQTSDPDIYAVGDAVEIENSVTGRKALIALAGPANKQARVAADNICGKPSRYLGSPASCILKVFGKAVASTGVNERAARALGMDYDKVVLFPASHAGYYPGGSEMMMKVLWSRGSGRILGAQIIGADGVDKRCDVIAAAMQAGMEARELAGLDLAYAPPYGSAKDPVNMAGFMIENIEDGLVRQFHWHDVPALQGDAQAFLLDARTPAEYAAGHAPGFVNIPLDSLRERLGEIPPGKTVYVMCRSGVRSYIGCRILEQNGFACRNFSGGYAFYKAAAEG